METIEKLTVTSTKDITARILCDKCKAVLYDIDNPPQSHSDAQKQAYYKMTSWHHDWGSESSESYERQHFCMGCIAAALTEFLQYPSYTKEMELEIQTPSRRGRKDYKLGGE